MIKTTVGDHVSIPAHARGTVWESGYVKHINRSGALIKYGAKKRGGIYGQRERVPLGELVKLEDRSRTEDLEPAVANKRLVSQYLRQVEYAARHL